MNGIRPMALFSVNCHVLKIHEMHQQQRHEIAESSPFALVCSRPCFCMPGLIVQLRRGMGGLRHFSRSKSE
jgi:hypothetical protein